MAGDRQRLLVHAPVVWRVRGLAVRFALPSCPAALLPLCSAYVSPLLRPTSMPTSHYTVGSANRQFSPAVFSATVGRRFFRPRPSRACLTMPHTYPHGCEHGACCRYREGTHPLIRLSLSRSGTLSTSIANQIDARVLWPCWPCWCPFACGVCGVGAECPNQFVGLLRALVYKQHDFACHAGFDRDVRHVLARRELEMVDAMQSCRMGKQAFALEWPRVRISCLRCASCCCCCGMCASPPHHQRQRGRPPGGGVERTCEHTRDAPRATRGTEIDMETAVASCAPGGRAANNCTSYLPQSRTIVRFSHELDESHLKTHRI